MVVNTLVCENDGRMTDGYLLLHVGETAYGRDYRTSALHCFSSYENKQKYILYMFTLQLYLLYF